MGNKTGDKNTVFRTVFFQSCLLSFCSHAKNVFPEKLHQCSVVTFFMLAKEHKWFARRWKRYNNFDSGFVKCHLQKKKANWIGHILLANFLLHQVIKGKILGRIEGKGRRGRRGKWLLCDLMEKWRYWKLKEALHRSLWRIGFGKNMELSWDRLRNKWTCHLWI
jgi:hypothetical protein